jgi:penicillin-binding protein 1C
MRSLARTCLRGVAALTCLAFVTLGATLWRLPPLDMTRFEQRSPVVLARGGEILHVALSKDHAYRLYTQVSDVDAKYVEALLALEDKHFWHHPGVDPLALVRAALQWLGAGQVVSGGSTITMQVARLLEPKPRTIASKWWEIARALELEWRYSKPEILSMYMTMLPMGGNVESVRAASLRYWGIEPLYLSLSEIALLLAVPQSPEARRPDLRPGYSLKTVQSVAHKLVDAAVFPSSDLNDVAQLPFERLHAMPQGVWHLTQAWLKEQHGPDDVLRSTIDARLQKSVERMAQMFGQRLNDEQNLALMVADGPTGDVLAYVGSLGLQSKAGFMDLTRATRSPGSSLKPFIYGMGFDDGLLDDQTLLDDRAKSFNGYAPSNFDRGFHGLVRAGEALQMSLNVPAVEVMSRLGANTFEDAWRSAGLSLSLPKGADANLGVTLGAAGVQLRGLVQAYTTFANDGRVQPLRTRLDEQSSTSRLLLTEQTAALITEILASAPTIDGRATRFTTPGQALALKTGTSYGYRDSWALGTKGRYVIGVWVGRPDATPEVGQTGRSAALRLAYDLGDALPKVTEKIGFWQPRPISEAERVQPQFELISPQTGSQLVLNESPGRARSVQVHYSGSLSGIAFKLNGLHVDLASQARLPVPVDGFYELEVVPRDGPTQHVLFAVFGRS